MLPKVLQELSALWLFKLLCYGEFKLLLGDIKIP